MLSEITPGCGLHQLPPRSAPVCILKEYVFRFALYCLLFCFTRLSSKKET